MNTHIFQIKIITPCSGLNMQAFENAAKALDCQLEFIDLGFEDAIQAAKNLSPSTCDVILSRGLIDIMRHHTSIPIIPITFSV